MLSAQYTFMATINPLKYTYIESEKRWKEIKRIV